MKRSDLTESQHLVALGYSRRSWDTMLGDRDSSWKIPERVNIGNGISPQTPTIQIEIRLSCGKLSCGRLFLFDRLDP
jgi:hypothetical protein